MFARADVISGAVSRPEEETLAAMSMAIAAPEGFTLHIARVSTSRHRQRLEQSLIAEVQARHPALRLLKLEVEGPVENLLSILSEAFAQHRPAVILLSGLEHLLANLPLEDKLPILTQLNANRDRLISLVPCSLVIWAQVPIIGALLKFAPELLQGAARAYDFTEPDPELASLLSRIDSARQQDLASQRPLLEEYLRRPLPDRDLDLQERASFPMAPSDRQLNRLEDLSIYYERWFGLSTSIECEPLRVLGEAAMRSGSFTWALRAFEQMGHLAAAQDLPVEQIVAQLKQGKAHQALGNTQQARGAFQFALRLAKQFKEQPFIERSAASLEQCCKQLIAEANYDWWPFRKKASKRSRQPRGSTLSRDSLRKLLQEQLEWEFDAFCLEHFPKFAARHSMALARDARIALLLESVNPEQIMTALDEH